MPGTAAKITITERQQEILQTLSRSVTAAARLRQRAAIIVLAFDGLLKEDIARRVGRTHRPVGRWRRRWARAWNRLVALACGGSRVVLRRAIEAVLTDEPRPGAPAKFTPERVAPILAVAGEPPVKSGRPHTHGPAQGRTDAVVRRGIVASLSPPQVSRSLRAAALPSHQSRSGLNTTATDPARFQEQVKPVCDPDLTAPERERTEPTPTVRVDERTGLQAVERIAPGKAMIAGKCERIECASARHGTLCRIGTVVVTTGEVLRPTIGPTRTAADVASPIEQPVAADAAGSWELIVDHWNIHGTETLVELVAEACVVPTDVGQKGVRGVLKSVASRQAFVSESRHRIRFGDLPKPSSWRNQLEVMFGVIIRKVIRRGSFTAVADWRMKLLNFIADFHRVFAKPFRWTYTGRPLMKAAARSWASERARECLPLHWFSTTKSRSSHLGGGVDRLGDGGVVRGAVPSGGRVPGPEATAGLGRVPGVDQEPERADESSARGDDEFAAVGADSVGGRGRGGLVVPAAVGSGEGATERVGRGAPPAAPSPGDPAIPVGMAGR